MSRVLIRRLYQAWCRWNAHSHWELSERHRDYAAVWRARAGDEDTIVASVAVGETLTLTERV